MSTANEVARDLIGFGVAASAGAQAVVVKFTAVLQRRVVANASGRPGPNAPTGDYRRSINRRVIKGTLVSEGYVGTDKPQGRRLELGFSGTDSLGRSYDQPPYPHFGPALDETAPEFKAAVAAVPGAAAKGLKPLPPRSGDIS